MAQKLAPAEKNSTDISAASATFCISGSMIVNQHQQLRLSEASDNVTHFLKLSDEYLMKSIQHRLVDIPNYY